LNSTQRCVYKYKYNQNHGIYAKTHWLHSTHVNRICALISFVELHWWFILCRYCLVWPRQRFPMLWWVTGHSICSCQRWLLWLLGWIRWTR